MQPLEKPSKNTLQLGGSDFENFPWPLVLRLGGFFAPGRGFFC